MTSSTIVRCRFGRTDSVWCCTWYARCRIVAVLLLYLVHTSNIHLHTRFFVPRKARDHRILSGKPERLRPPAETLRLRTGFLDPAGFAFGCPVRRNLNTSDHPISPLTISQANNYRTRKHKTRQVFPYAVLKTTQRSGFSHSVQQQREGRAFRT